MSFQGVRLFRFINQGKLENLRLITPNFDNELKV
jgi:hypothetical protein